MAKNQQTKLKETPRLVEKVYEYRGIKVGVRIDFRQKKISLTEADGQAVKRWVFAERTLEYMDGWLNILHAMEHAIQAARGELQAYVDLEEKKKAELMVAIARAEDSHMCSYNNVERNGKQKNCRFCNE